LFIFLRPKVARSLFGGVCWRGWSCSVGHCNVLKLEDWYQCVKCCGCAAGNPVYSGVGICEFMPKFSEVQGCTLLAQFLLPESVCSALFRTDADAREY
jgi:hypothetical protein